MVFPWQFPQIISYIVPSTNYGNSSGSSNGMFIGVMQTYRNMEKIQDRITRFIASHSKMPQKRIEQLMLTPPSW